MTRKLKRSIQKHQANNHNQQQGLIIPAYTLTQTQIDEIKRRERVETVSLLREARIELSEHTYHVDKIITQVSYNFSLSYSLCLHSIEFADSPTWHGVVIARRERLDKSYTELGDAVHYCDEYLAKALEGMGLEIEVPSYKELLIKTELLHSEMKGVLSEALVSDNLEPLRKIHEDRSRKDILDALREENEKVYTTTIALETELARATVYIGLEALRLQHKEGIKSITKQWKTIWRNLNAQKHLLNGDMLAAWEYLHYLDVGSINNRSEERKVDQQIDKMKRKMKPFYTLS